MQLDGDTILERMGDPAPCSSGSGGSMVRGDGLDQYCQCQFFDAESQALALRLFQWGIVNPPALSLLQWGQGSVE